MERPARHENSDNGRMLRLTLFSGLSIFALVAAVAQSPQAGYQVEVQRSPTQNDIQGFVYDQAGNSIAAASVVVKDMGSGLENTVTSGDDGSYHFNHLKTTDTYELSVTLPGFESFDVKGVNIGWKLATRLDIVLRPK